MGEGGEDAGEGHSPLPSSLVQTEENIPVESLPVMGFRVPFPGC